MANSYVYTLHWRNLYLQSNAKYDMVDKSFLCFPYIYIDVLNNLPPLVADHPILIDQIALAVSEGKVSQTSNVK